MYKTTFLSDWIKKPSSSLYEYLAAYETTDYISEILSLFDSVNFFDLFNVNIILTKAIPQATERIQALRNSGYTPFEWDESNRKYYWVKNKAEETAL